MASARIPRFDWTRGAEFSVTLFLLNDSPAAIAPLEFTVTLKAGGQTLALGTWHCPGTPANTHCTGPKISGVVPDWTGETFDLCLEVAGHPALSSRYTLVFKSSC